MQELKLLISEKRSIFYIDHANSINKEAFDVYMENIQISQKFYLLMHFIEIILRNKITKYLDKKWNNWSNIDSYFALSILNKGLMQRLLTGKVRLPGFNEGWHEIKLEEVCDISKGIQFNKKDLDDFGTYPCINGGIEPSGYTDNFNTPKNTITISEGGNSCGYVNFLIKDFWCGGHCYTIKNLSIDKYFLYQILKLLERRIMSLRVGSGLPNIQKKSLNHLKLVIPKSKEEQIAIANILTTADKEIETLEKKLALLED